MMKTIFTLIVALLTTLSAAAQKLVLVPKNVLQ